MIAEVDPAAGEFRRRAESEEEHARLRREAEVLTVARHPGVVQLLGWDGATLRLRLLRSTPPADTTTVAVVSATTLADLHDLGVAHGDLQPDDLRYDETGAPVLCGFGRAGAALGAGGDVAALAAVLSQITDDPGQQQVLARAVAAGRRRLSARQLAQLLAAPARPAARRPRARVGAAVAASAAVVVLAAAARTLAMVVSAGAASGPATPAAPACPLVDLGCGPLPRPGGVVTVAAGHYRIGGPGEVVVVGRWGCHGPLAALLDPATGQVWAFHAWAPAGAALSARLVTVAPGAVSMTVEVGRNGCDSLRVVRSTGETVAVHPETGP